MPRDWYKLSVFMMLVWAARGCLSYQPHVVNGLDVDLTEQGRLELLFRLRCDPAITVVYIHIVCDGVVTKHIYYYAVYCN